MGGGMGLKQGCQAEYLRCLHGPQPHAVHCPGDAAGVIGGFERVSDREGGDGIALFFGPGEAAGDQGRGNQRARTIVNHDPIVGSAAQSKEAVGHGLLAIRAAGDNAEQFVQAMQDVPAAGDILRARDDEQAVNRRMRGKGFGCPAQDRLAEQGGKDFVAPRPSIASKPCAEARRGDKRECCGRNRLPHSPRGWWRRSSCLPLFAARNWS